MGQFPDWHIDCEYNRQGLDPKKLGIGEDAKPVRPDVIIHRRDTDQNLVVIEVKKTTNKDPDKNDLQKLHGFVREYGYRHALFLRLHAKVQEPSVAGFRWIY
jgi:hypothetical protein